MATIDALEQILASLKNIEKALEPKTYEVHVEPNNFKVAEGLTAKKLAEDLAWQFRGDHGAVPSSHRLKAASELVRGDTVVYEGHAYRVGKVLKLAHGAVWIYDDQGNLTERLSTDREVKVAND
jgi:hypothetical protein